ncbi:MAG: NirA family protein, partial [Planctomycetota bacterium]
MTETATLNPTATTTGVFTAEQKEFLSGFMAGVAQRGLHPYVGTTATGQLTGDPAQGGANLAEETIYGTPLGDVTKQERWKHEEHPLDGWDRLLAHAEAGKFPDEEHTFRFRNFGMFYVAPAQNSFMLRCRIPAGELTAAQLRGLADIADDFGNGKSAVTTRSNIQIREIGPANLVNVITRLQSLGLTARGSGVDNIRNVTASPTAGFDPRELLDTRPFAHALHHYILNHREFYNLPRKFNFAIEGGGAVDTVADTNDIGFMAVSVGSARVPRAESGVAPDSRSSNFSEVGGKLDERDSRRDASNGTPEACAPQPGIYFRVELCGITGHKQLAADSGILVKPTEALAVCAAMIRVFLENGDRTDRKKARLKYLVDKWGVEKFLAETQKKLAFPLVKFPLEQCIKRPAAVKHGHVGVYRQRQAGKNYIG